MKTQIQLSLVVLIAILACVPNVNATGYLDGANWTGIDNIWDSLGLSYLKNSSLLAGGNITVSKNDNGTVTISSTAGMSNPATADFNVAGYNITNAGNVSAKNIGGVVYADQYATIHDAIDAVSVTGGIVYLPAGTYPVTLADTITTNNITFQGSGVGASILSFGSDADAQLYFNGVTNIAFKDLTISSANNIATDRVKFNAVNGITFNNIKVHGGSKYFANFAVHFNTGNTNIKLLNIEVTADNDITADSLIRFYGMNTHVTIVNYYAHDLQVGDAIDLYGLRDSTVTNFIGEHIGQGIGIYADAQNITLSNIVIRDAGGATSPYIGAGQPLAISTWDGKTPHDIIVSNMKILDTTGHGIQINGDGGYLVHNISLSNIDITNTTWSGIMFDGTGNYSNIYISDYTAHNTGYATGNMPIGINTTSTFDNVFVFNSHFADPLNFPNIPVNGGITYTNVRGLTGANVMSSSYETGGGDKYPEMWDRSNATSHKLAFTINTNNTNRWQWGNDISGTGIDDFYLWNPTFGTVLIVNQTNGYLTVKGVTDFGNSATAPTAFGEGDTYYNSTSNTEFLHDGTRFITGYGEGTMIFSNGTNDILTGDVKQKRMMKSGILTDIYLDSIDTGSMNITVSVVGGSTLGSVVISSGTTTSTTGLSGTYNAGDMLNFTVISNTGISQASLTIKYTKTS